MSDLTRADVEYIAELARLKLNEEEIEMYQQQLSRILTYIEELDQLDTDHIPPTTSVLPLKNIFAEDHVHSPFSRQDILRNAPEIEAGQFRVRAILD